MISCAGGCDKKVEDPQQVGWQYLEITGRFRCGDCGRALAAAIAAQEAAPDTVDTLPPDSRGALPKDKHTVLPPTVRG